jgi:hypothetical protein
MENTIMEAVRSQVIDLENEYLYNIDFRIGQISDMTSILTEQYLEKSYKVLEENVLDKEIFASSYRQIQAITMILSESAESAQNLIDGFYKAVEERFPRASGVRA